MTIIWCMVPEIWSMIDRIFCHFGLFFALLPPNNKNLKFWKNEKNSWRYYHFIHVYQKWQSYDVWFLRYWAQRTEFFVNLDHFLHFYPLNNLKNQNFEKMKKIPGDIIILHKCTLNGNHMMYGSWDMKCGRQNYLSFWTVFCPFTTLTTPKIKIWKTEKTPRNIIILHKWTRNHDHMLYCSLDIACNGCNCCFSFWGIFCPFTFLTARKIKIKKKKRKKKKAGDIIILQ